ncbi:MAG TPA: class II aldolase/adducin family protein [Opitutus sp.]|nr:class II aldolase/adducin family protein [Opitutus sp.]
MSSALHESLKAEMIRTCRAMERIGHFIGTWGNISVRVSEGFIVTPSRVNYDAITPADFVTVSLEGGIIAGHRLPSSETGVHRLVLKKKPDVGAIIHSHPPYASAVACLQRSIPVFVEDIAQIIGGEVKCTRYVPAGQHEKIAAEVANTIGDENAVLLANHGALVCGRTLDEAFVACQILEKAAQMLLLTEGAGGPLPIPEEHVRSERHRFLHKYGTANDRG